MTQRNDERWRGVREASGQLDVLREKWPKAFPLKGHDVRPLAGGAAQVIAEALGWNISYTRGVLQVWKSRHAYCRAVMAYSRRMTLDGVMTDEGVDDIARSHAKAAIERMAEKKARNAEKARALEEAARANAVEQAPPAIPVEEPAPAPVVEPAQPAKRVVLGSAAMAEALKRRLANGPTTTQVVTATIQVPPPRAAAGKSARR